MAAPESRITKVDLREALTVAQVLRPSSSPGAIQQYNPVRPAEKLKPAEGAPTMKTKRSHATPNCPNRGPDTTILARTTRIAMHRTPTMFAKTSIGSAVMGAHGDKAPCLGVLG